MIGIKTSFTVFTVSLHGKWKVAVYIFTSLALDRRQNHWCLSLTQKPKQNCLKLNISKATVTVERLKNSMT